MRRSLCVPHARKKTFMRRSPSMSYCSQPTFFFWKKKYWKKSANIPCLKRIEMRKSKLYFS